MWSVAVSFLQFTLLSTAFAVTIGPYSNLYIGNKVIAPDGTKRSYVLVNFVYLVTYYGFRTVLAGRDARTLSFPGPLIQNIKVISASLSRPNNWQFDLNFFSYLSPARVTLSFVLNSCGIYERYGWSLDYRCALTIHAQREHERPCRDTNSQLGTYKGSEHRFIDPSDTRGSYSSNACDTV